MKQPSIPGWAWYAGLPVVYVALWLLRWEDGDPVRLVAWGAALAFGYCAAVSDIRHRIVPNRLLLYMLGTWCLILIPQLFLQTEQTLALVLSGVMGLLLAGILLLVVYGLSRRGLGGGDVKFMAVAGLYLGVEQVLAVLLIGSVGAAVTGIGLIVAKKIGRSDAIPLIPFLYLGMVVTILFS